MVRWTARVRDRLGPVFRLLGRDNAHGFVEFDCEGIKTLENGDRVVILTEVTSPERGSVDETLGVQVD